MKTKKKINQNTRLRTTAIIILCLFVIVTGTLFSLKSFQQGNTTGGIMGIVIAAAILFLAIRVYRVGNKSIQEGYPLHDERSRRVIEKASSTAFYISLYLLLAIGFLSEDMIPFRDVSQATGITVGGMAILFAICWVFYNNKEI